jgi:hypothetical protein
MTPSIDVLLSLAFACLAGCVCVLVWLFRTVTLHSSTRPVSANRGHRTDGAGDTGALARRRGGPNPPQAWPEHLRSWSLPARQLHASDRWEQEALYRYLRRRQFARRLPDSATRGEADQRLHRSGDATPQPPSPAGDAEGRQADET